MESCFPPLASLRGSSNSASSSTTTSHQKNRHSLGSSNGSELAVPNDYLPKLDVIEDLDLYYIRQIACSLKVSISIRLWYLQESQSCGWIQSEEVFVNARIRIFPFTRRSVMKLFFRRLAESVIKLCLHAVNYKVQMQETSQVAIVLLSPANNLFDCNLISVNINKQGRMTLN